MKTGLLCLEAIWIVSPLGSEQRIMGESDNNMFTVWGEAGGVFPGKNGWKVLWKKKTRTFFFFFFPFFVFMYFLLFKTIKNCKTMIKITTITGKSIKKYNKAASYNIKFMCKFQDKKPHVNGLKSFIKSQRKQELVG